MSVRREGQVKVALWGPFIQLSFTEEPRQPRLSGHDLSAHFVFSQQRQTWLSSSFLQITEAQPVERFFNVLGVLRTFSRSDREHFALRHILLQLPLAEEYSAVGSLRPGTHQQDVGSVASALQQRG